MVGSKFNGLVSANVEVADISGVPGPGVSGSVSLATLAASDFGFNAFPHWGQKLAGTRMDTPQVGQRRAISGLGIVGISDFSNPMHGIKEVFALRVDTDSKFLPFQSQTLFQFGCAFARA